MRLYFEQPAGATGYLVLPQLHSGLLLLKQAIGASYEIIATTTTVHSQSPYDASVHYSTATEAQVARQLAIPGTRPRTQISPQVADMRGCTTVTRICSWPRSCTRRCTTARTWSGRLESACGAS